MLSYVGNGAYTSVANRTSLFCKTDRKSKSPELLKISQSKTKIGAKVHVALVPV